MIGGVHYCQRLPEVSLSNEEKLTIGMPPLRAEAADQAPSLSALASDAGCVASAVVPPAGVSIGTADRSLQQACAVYWAVNLELDRLLLDDEDPADSRGLYLHRKWMRALLKVLSLPAETPDGERAKTAILRNAVEIVFGQTADEGLSADDLAAVLRRKRPR